ncbi:hypothetical protein LCGC14_0655910 [marine sediment metagenome]|uniref:Glycosyltransferase RgtA/B/C/D-like domain-containing protein n=1 Tax=marine sediment metagenome TaxID=412755 RepID=A0A0F9REV8_9ZZZZ
MKLKEWLKENWILVGIVSFAIIVRIYYFILTQGQALWWDEAEYLNIAKRFAFDFDYKFGPVRPILFSFIASLFLKISSSEFLPRVFLLVLSVASVIGMYYFGKELYNKTVGLISSFLMSIFYLNLFFTYRLLVDLPALTFFIFSGFLFFRYFKTKSSKSLYAAAIVVGIGTLFKLSTAFILFACLIYLLITERLNFLRKKEIWIATFIFIVILAPYIIWGYIEFGSLVLTQASSHVAPESYFSGITILKNYLINFPTYFSWTILVAFILGIVSMYRLVLYFDKVIGGDEILRRDLYLLLVLIVPFILISTLINHNEDRYIMIIFPSILIISSSFIRDFYYMIKKKGRVMAIILVAIILTFTSLYQLDLADSLIKNKESSYLQVKEAGIWLKENSNISNIIATRSQPQIRYYSERKTIGIPATEEEFESSLTPDVKFYMLSIFEAHPEWAYTYPGRKNLTIERDYLTQDKQPILIIYNLK